MPKKFCKIHPKQQLYRNLLPSLNDLDCIICITNHFNSLKSDKKEGNNE